MNSNDVRSIALNYGYQEIPVEHEHMLSFRHVAKCGGVRISVHVATGRVELFLDTAVRGHQTLAKQVNSYKQLHAMFADPKMHTARPHSRSPAKIRSPAKLSLF